MPLSWLPNAICVFRVLLVGPVVVVLLREQYVAALILIAIAGFSDALDGLLARSFGWRTPLGSILDPAADKLLIVSVYLTLTYQGLVPVGLTALVVTRDVVIISGAVTYQLLIGPVRGEPTLISKFTGRVERIVARDSLGWGRANGVSLQDRVSARLRPSLPSS